MAQVINTKQFEEPNLLEGQCHTVAGSKVYLKDVKNSKTQTATEIGLGKIADLENSENESYFFCKTKCNIQGNNLYVWAKQKDKNENFKNMNGFVCTGLDIQDVAVSTTMSIKTTVAIPYYAAQSQNADIHAMLKSMSYKLNLKTSNQLRTDFYQVLRAVQMAYSYANTEAFQHASAELLKYLPETESSAGALKEKLAELSTAELESPKSIMDSESGEALVNLFLKQNAMFMLYVER